MDEQYQQFLQWLQQQKGGTPNNSMMQGYTQNLWNQQTPNFAPTNTTPPTEAPSLGMQPTQLTYQPFTPPAYVSPLQQINPTFNPNIQADQNPSLSVDLGGYRPQSFSPDLSAQQNEMTGYVAPEMATLTTPVTEQQPQQNNQQNLNYFLNNAFTPMSTETSTFRLGESLAFNNNNPYATDTQKGANTVRGIAAGAKTLSSLLRTGLSGAAYQNKTNQSYTDYRNRQSQQNFAPDNSFEDGGELSQEKFLTGSYIGNQAAPNAEIEKDEFVQSPDGSVRQAVGDRHEQGGIPVSLEQGSRVISDNLKIGGKTARELKKEYGIEVKANHTFADAVEKYKTKIGLSKIDKEQEELFKKLQDKADVKDEQTATINDAYLGKQIQETEAAKTPLKEQLTGFTDKLFQKQESLKGTSQELKFENGGKYDDGGIVPNPYDNSNFGYQPTVVEGQFYGDVNAQNYDARIAEIKRLHPEIYNQLFDGNKLKNGVSWADYQKSINGKYDQILGDYANIYGQNSNEYKTLSQQIAAQKFTNEGSRAIDNKLGNFTSSRPNFTIDLATPEQLQNLNNRGIYSYSQLKQKDPELYKQIVGSKVISSDAYIGKVPTQAQVVDNAPDAQAPIVIPQNRTQFGGLNLIDQSMPPPSGLQASRLGEAQYRNYEVVQQGFEPQLQQLYNQESAAVDQIAGLSPAARAAALAGISANTQSAALGVVGQVNNANQVEAARIGNANTDLFNRYNLQNNAFRDQFEQNTYQAMANTDASLQNWFTYNNELNALNRQQNLSANTLANLFPNTTFNSEGVVGSNGVNPQYYNNQGLPVTTTATTKKKK